MIVLTKRNILYTICAVAMFVFAYVIMGYNIQNNFLKKQETRQTVALPVNRKTIVIDAGHGVPDERSRKLKWNNRGQE